MTNRKELLREFLLMNLGTLLVSVGVYFFKFPNHFSMAACPAWRCCWESCCPSSSPSTFNTIINVLFLVLGFVMHQQGLRRPDGLLFHSSPPGLIQLFEWAFPMDRPLTDQLMLELFFAVISRPWLRHPFQHRRLLRRHRYRRHDSQKIHRPGRRACPAPL